MEYLEKIRSGAAGDSLWGKKPQLFEGSLRRHSGYDDCGVILCLFSRGG
jgi:hypothetical protein